MEAVTMSSAGLSEPQRDVWLQVFTYAVTDREEADCLGRSFMEGKGATTSADALQLLLAVSSQPVSLL